ncbi:zinc-binding domain-containing protein [Fusarium tricinctum]|jgi:hypothetical protein|uniref:Zinc-binding domain-containing protein n=1 Tax=Fusarium tricinctum TaxID=61284 RepID=A0A8K0RT70_9HYPO|nr:zinc-binding domain-containing protein [Fusarium tricinctum]
MPRENPKPEEGPAWMIYPGLHEEVAEKLEEFQLDYSFNLNDDDVAKVRHYDTHIMGRFACNNKKCKKSGWSTKQLAITIREYTRDRYNARVYLQRCKRCKSLGQLKLNEESYIDRVAYRIKKWNGIEMELPMWSRTSERPHEEDLCEGCADGHCAERGFDRIELV